MAPLEPVPEIGVDELADRLRDDIVLVDVREPDEYVAGHVRTAIPIPLGEVPARSNEIPTDGAVYLICARGGRSRQAAEYLAARGVRAINVAGGTMGWIDSGRTVVTGDERG